MCEETSKKYRKKHRLSENFLSSKLQLVESKVIYESNTDCEFSKNTFQPFTSMVQGQAHFKCVVKSFLRNICWSFRSNQLKTKKLWLIGQLYKIIAPSNIKRFHATVCIVRITKAAKNYINVHNIISTWCLIFTYKMVCHIKQCTKAEARRQLKMDTRTITFDEIYAVPFCIQEEYTKQHTFQ